MIYNQVEQANDVIMPFLMGCTRPDIIQTEPKNEKFTYDPCSQKGVYGIDSALRRVGTYSLKNNQTLLGGGRAKLDKKNEIDDSKWVK